MIPTIAPDLYTLAGPMNDGPSGDADHPDTAADELGDWWLDLGYVALPAAAAGV